MWKQHVNVEMRWKQSDWLASILSQHRRVVKTLSDIVSKFGDTTIVRWFSVKTEEEFCHIGVLDAGKFQGCVVKAQSLLTESKQVITAMNIDISKYIQGKTDLIISMIPAGWMMLKNTILENKQMVDSMISNEDYMKIGPACREMTETFQASYA